VFLLSQYNFFPFARRLSFSPHTSVSTWTIFSSLQFLPPPPLTPNTLKSPRGNFYRCVVNISFSMELLIWWCNSEPGASALPWHPLPPSLSLSLSMSTLSWRTVRVPFRKVYPPTCPSARSLKSANRPAEM